MRTNVKKEEEDEGKQIGGLLRLGIIWELLEYSWEIWKIDTSGGLGQEWSIPNNFAGGEVEKERNSFF